MIRSIAPFIFCSLFVVTGFAHAQEANSEPRIARDLTDTALAFVRIRIDRLEIAPLIELSEKYLLVSDEMASQVKVALTSLDILRDQLVSQGVTDAYVAFELEHLMHGPYVLIDYKPGSDVQRIRTTLNAAMVLANITEFSQTSLKNPEFTDLGRMLFAGHGSVLAHIQAGHVGERPALAAALAEVEEHPLQFIVCPSTDQRRAIKEAVPSFPAPFDRLNGDVLSRGIEYLAVGASVSPELGLHVAIRSDDEQAAETIRLVQSQALDYVLEVDQLRQMFPEIDNLLSQFRFQREGTLLSVRLTADDKLLNQVGTMLAIPLRQMQQANGRNRSKNNLKQLGIAMHNWHEAYKVFPAHANYSPEGKPLLSWRVHVLPYLDQQALYNEFHLDESWDSEHNKQLIARMPPIFAVPGSAVASEGKTCYVLPILPEGAAITSGTKDGIQLQEITDGTSNTVLTVVADDEHSVIWTKPDDLTVDPENPLRGLRIESGAFTFGLADGSVQSFPANFPPAEWLKMLTRAGKEIVQRP
ncbi:MAG TPA: DUF1559 domain-containing protein [Planctomycetaceae bacterium]|nr:DUF1559 domain-containing protein [Planctomycetaceae bacterium]